MRTLICTLYVICLPAWASQSGFIEKRPYSSGAAVIVSAAGGEYVHGDQTRDARVRSAPILVQAPVRQSYSLYTSEEQGVLFAYVDRERARLVKKPTAVRSASTGRQRWEKLDWPKVVLRGDDICVPTLESSNAPDWRSHLLCHRVEGEQQ